MTQYNADADNGIDTADGLTLTRSGTKSITSSSVANPSNILCVGHGMVSTESTTIDSHSGSTPDINGDHIITRIDDDNYTIPVNVTVGGTGGTSQELDGPWATFHKYTENARSAGDRLRCRRGMTANYDDGGLLAFTSDGTILLPLVLEADYDDSWGDFVNSDQTYTPVFGALTMEASGTITTLVAGEWVFNTTDGDNNRDFSYEVKSVSGTTLTFYIPWKGSTGSGKTLTVMPSSSAWHDLADAFQFQLSSDFWWKFQGLLVRGTNTTSSAGLCSLSNQPVTIFKDMVWIANNSFGYLFISFKNKSLLVSKSRSFDGLEVILVGSSNEIIDLQMADCLWDGNNVSSSKGLNNSSGILIATLIDCEFKNHGAFGDINYTNSGTADTTLIKARNTQFNSSNPLKDTDDKNAFTFFEDAEGVESATSYFSELSSANEVPLYESETTTVRSGGSNISTKVTPGTNIGPESILSTVIPLDIAIKTTTDSKTYDIYFRPDATANWTDDPTAAQLWIELEAWGHASNNSRKITKSTGVIDMNGSTAWQKLSVTVAPGQAGVAYLRVKYTKPKESAKTNVFFIDPEPVVT